MEFDLNQYIRAELYIILPFLIGIGAILKKTIKKSSRRFIPAILLSIGIPAAVAGLIIIDHDNIPYCVFMGIMQGGIIASAATGIHQVVKQFKCNPKDGE